MVNGQVLPLVACTLPDMTWDAIRSAPGGASDGEVRLGGHLLALGSGYLTGLYYQSRS